ncbi:hypothetical protein E3N88_12047 [Mikania micrantha]|uniref:Integrase catalytic domain-containing protein n=1 Tax=Mikania micrantha TaxID=192012 RepID=A0A5N6P5R4_9ASTR|nr:hypothetical protein E3N88_12047 [Mikania micrantha]
MIVCIAVVGHQNNPLYIQSFTEADDALKLHHIVHCSLDVVDERAICGVFGTHHYRPRGVHGPFKSGGCAAVANSRYVKGLRGFLGLTGYYRKFVKDYGSIARPLTDLTKKDAFQWTPTAQRAFDLLKNGLITALVLALLNFTVPVVVECDASGRGIGAVLMQHNRPIAYFSKALSDRNLSKSAYERELMALVLAVQRWRPYLLGNHFTICTNQKSLKFLLQQRISTTDQQNWLAKLLGYDFDILYKPGRENRAADALSRRAELGELSQAISAPIWKCILQPFKFQHYSVKNGLLYYKDRIVIPRLSKFIPELFHEFHTTASGGHSGFYCTYRRLAANLYWPGMTSDVKKFIRECDICQRCKTFTTTPSGLLQPLAIPEMVWDDLSMDFITGLPSSKGFTVIFVVVDRLSKYAHFVPLRHPYTAKSVADVFIKEIIRHHGIPKTIVSDRDPLFLSKFWQEIFRSMGTKLNMSSVYHPESDCQSEVRFWVEGCESFDQAPVEGCESLKSAAMKVATGKGGL